MIPWRSGRFRNASHQLPIFFTIVDAMSCLADRRALSRPSVPTGPEIGGLITSIRFPREAERRLAQSITRSP